MRKPTKGSRTGRPLRRRSPRRPAATPRVTRPRKRDISRVRYRRARRQDMLACMRFIIATYGDLRRRRGFEPVRARPRRVPELFMHLQRTDPKSAYCAWDGTRLVGYAAAINRGRHWFLSEMFVHPRYQQRGIGKHLMDLVWRDGANVTHSLATFTYNMQSVGLYSRSGMAPAMLLTLMIGDTARIRCPRPTSLTRSDRLTAADRRWINALEQRIRGFAHPTEWRHWCQNEEFQACLFSHRGRRVGYGLLSRRGELSPIGAISPIYLDQVVREMIRLGSAGVPGWKPITKLMLACPGENRTLFHRLTQMGFRSGEIFLFMSDRLEPDFRRYLPANLAIF